MSDFWSRRKAMVEAETRAEATAAENAAMRAEEARLAECSDEELLEELGLPVPEMVDSAEMVQTYLRSALPRRLKQRALRRLWTLNPVLANLDGLVEYGEDYTDSAKVVDNLQTAYQVGRGMLAHIEKLAAICDAPEIAMQEEAVTVPGEERAPDPEDAAQPESGPEPDASGQDAAMAVPSRRMRFRFEPEDQGMTDR
ncbi:DUF3306 domain-containing protein [Paracoccus alkanivorans]|uniref:DUF3306 domain-containing protein n=1 Tax=Paracoccus alkanivorans TaxID=2116655 RepID=A0A3M0M226_9RHOB|nr:DUF3306 domain-containing protein [Paracoccus alkanivorans]RMC31183.1 DUF3306 domain-containing protein [Paracoccus alkanivorans]